MSLQFILGPAGSGKSDYLYDTVCREAETNKKGQFFVLVPEQFTLETQRICVNKSKGRGIMNIDVLSFHRLAYRVFEQIPAWKRTVLEDTGKTMLVRKVLAEQKRKLKYFGKGIEKPGFLDELKSFLCELLLYRVDEEKMEDMISAANHGSLMEYKLKDLQLIYQCFLEKLGTEYMTAEEILPQLSKVVPDVEMLRGSTITLDGFTGFTPSQYELIRELLRVCGKMYLVLDFENGRTRDELFYLSRQTILAMTKLAGEIDVLVEEPVYTGRGKEKIPYRFKKGGELLHLERNLFATRYKKFSASSGELEIWENSSPKSESVHVVKEIDRLISEEGYRYGEIAVITGQLEAYREFLSMEMNRRKIRYFFDSKQSIGANVCSEFVLSMLEMFRKNFDYETTFRFLRCGLSPLEQEETDLLENYVLAQGIHTFAGYQREWSYMPDYRRECNMEVLNQIRIKFIHSIQESRERFRGGEKTVETYVRILYDVLVGHNIYRRLLEKEKEFEETGMVLLAKEYGSVYSVLMDLFDQMVELLGEEEISFKEFCDLLQAGISEGLVGFVPPSMDQVVIGDMERSRLAHIRVLFFIGINDGFVPKTTGGPGVLSERERMILEENGSSLAPGIREQVFTSQFYMYLALTRPSEKLYLSYFQRATDGSEARPSYLIRKIHLLFPELVVKREREKTPRDYLGTDLGRQFLLQGLSSYHTGEVSPIWCEVFRYYKLKSPEWIDQVMERVFSEREETTLSKEAVDLIYGDVLKGSVTRLERYARCPYSHFAAYGLELNERQMYRIGLPDFGNVFHEVLERFAGELVKNKVRWRDVHPTQMDEWIEQSVEESIAGYRNEMFFQDRRTAYISKRMNRILKRTVRAIARQMQSGRYEQSGYEISFSRLSHAAETTLPLVDGKQMELQGRIDRVDTYEMEDKVFVRVIDYKTGTTKLELNSMYYGLQMQLAVYLQVASSLEKQRGKEVVPAGMFYYHISDPVIQCRMDLPDEKRELELTRELRMSGLVAEDSKILQSMDMAFGQGETLLPSVESNVIPMATGKNGQIKTGKGMIGSRAFISRIIKHTETEIEKFGNEIVKGHKEVRPTLLGAKTGCDYCPYSNVCGFDPENPKYRYRELESLKQEEIFERLKNESERRD